MRYTLLGHGRAMPPLRNGSTGPEGGSPCIRNYLQYRYSTSYQYGYSKDISSSSHNTCEYVRTVLKHDIHNYGIDDVYCGGYHTSSPGAISSVTSSASMWINIHINTSNSDIANNSEAWSYDWILYTIGCNYIRYL